MLKNISTKNPVNQSIAEKRWMLFGISCIWIFYRHTFYFEHFSFSILDPIIRIGDCGVDIFLFLSGYGLYFSFSKMDSRITDFYHKRLWRILPTVVLLFVTFAVIELMIGKSIDDFLSVRFWFYQIYAKYWYVGAILLFYLLFPLIYYILKISPVVLIASAYIIGIGGIGMVDFFDIGVLGQLRVYFARIPIFVLGSVLAYKHQWFEQKTCLYMMFLFGVILAYTMPKDIQRLTYSLMTPAIILVLQKYINYLPRFINVIIQEIGRASLEFYLIHIFAFYLGFVSITNLYLNSEVLTSLLILILISLVSILSHKSIDYLSKKVKHAFIN